MTHVAYKGGAPMISDLLTGRIDFAFSTYSTIKGNLDDLKVLAVATPERMRGAPKCSHIVRARIFWARF